jgi:cytochrome c oxidase subunit II
MIDFLAIARAAKSARFVGAAAAGSLAAVAGAGAAWAQEQVQGYATPGQMSLMEPQTPIARELTFFHNSILLPLTIVISLFVLALLVYVMFRFNEKANPTPSRTTHHALLEVAWTIVPVLILVVIAVPSFRLLTHQLVMPTSDVTVKVTGKQWYWSYDYPKDQGGGFGIDSILKDEKDMKPGDLRLLAVDNEAVVPVGKVVRLQVTAADVIHSFVIQSFGIRIDAVPGRLNETWFKAEKEGIYYGQCSKICGKDHAYMPIAFRVVSPDKYAEWLASHQKKKSASLDRPVTTVAETQR